MHFEIGMCELGFVRNGQGIYHSPHDTNHYRVLTLPNTMRVVLISDPATQQAGGAVTVMAGYWSDPEELPGLAHFCEHMLFLGTEKYPEENGYAAFLSAHGGSHNAYTAQDNTTYFFEVQQEHLEHTLDRLAQFFIAPLFTESATAREMLAIDSENNNNLQQDAWRFSQIQQHLGSRDHPYHKYGTGNAETLGKDAVAAGIDTRAALLKFYQDHYSANKMVLTILGREDLDTLQKWAEDKFSAVQNRNCKVQVFNGKPFTPDQMATRLQVQCVMDGISMVLSWYLPSNLKQHQTSPGSYLGHMIGHEGPGSILALLKKKGWANFLMAGSPEAFADFEPMPITIGLTPEGLDHVNDIVAIIYQYIHMLSEAGPEQWTWEESLRLNALSALYLEKGSPSATAMSTSQRVARLALSDEWVVLGGGIPNQFDPDTIRSHLSILANPANMRLAVLAPDLTVDSVEPYYGTKYSVQPIAPELLKIWASLPKNPDLFLPSANPFIPTDLSLKGPVVPRNSLAFDLPTLVEEDAQMKIWHKLDTSFNVPKASIFMNVCTPLAYSSPENHIMTFLFVELVKSSLNEYTYDAGLASASYTTEVIRTGFQILFLGYSDKLLVLVEKVLQRLTDVVAVLDLTQFDMYLDLIKKNKKNAMQNPAYQIALYYDRMTTAVGRFHHDETRAACSKVTYEGLRAFIPKLLASLNFDILVHGNLNQQDVALLKNAIQHNFKAPPIAKVLQTPTVILPTEYETHCVRESRIKDDVNNATASVFQIGRASYRSAAVLDLLSTIIVQPFMTQLRTQEQLGYIVHSAASDSSGVLSLMFLVQSEKSVEYLDERIEAFVAAIPVLTPLYFHMHNTQR
eukprot:TRINITY_DN9830_c1_g1_i1.p1 TRINITY_DN9830_c1_g1~~TRINITY_DN9830_c1_g1_i1.p1  ORF type:complete len:861 (+),score=158.14 TRINITY_DN9830_c1_g1_i1:22-2583(+)